MFVIKLDKTDYNNLIAFLQRANLTGQEAPAFYKVMREIANAKQEERVDNIDKK
jgi:hypothetical protein